MTKGKRYRNCMPFILFITLLLSFKPVYCAGTEKAVFPFYPSLISPFADMEITDKDFKGAISCRGCHLITFKEWEGSPHSLAFHDPVFLAMWRAASRDTDGKTDKFCLGCHMPIGLVTSDVSGPQDEKKANQISLNGVQCDFCHTVSSSNYIHSGIGYPHNASLVVQPGKVKWGPIDNCKSKFHESGFSELHTRSEFCGNCHNLFLPDSGLQIVRTYNEWKSSIYAQKGIACQDCHMMPDELAKEVSVTFNKPKNPGKAASVGGPERDTIHVHKFAGSGFILENALISTAKLKEATQRLKWAAKLETEFIQSPSDPKNLLLKVTVYNEGAGHNLPTGMPGIRQIWLEVIVNDKNGKKVFHSGGIDDSGNIQEGSIRLVIKAKDESGLPTYNPWEIAELGSDTTIPAKGKSSYEFELKMNEDPAWPLAAKVILHYRAFPPPLLGRLLPGPLPDIPIIDMATKELSISGRGHLKDD